MRLRHIEIFSSVMAHGSATGAAKHLKISQPSVTSAIKQAERDIGFQLFRRQGRGLSPTKEAQELAAEVAHAMESLESVQLVADRLKRGTGGKLKVAAIPTLGESVFAEAVARFKSIASRYSFEFTSQHGDEILHNIDERAGRYDIGFTFGTARVHGVAHEVIGHVKLYCLALKEWRTAAYTSASEFKVSELDGVDMIATFDADPLGQTVIKLLNENHVQPLNVASVHNHRLAASLVAKGLGVAILDGVTIEAVMRSSLAGKLEAYPLDEAVSLPVTAVYSTERSLTSAGSQFIACMAGALQELEY